MAVTGDQYLQAALTNYERMLVLVQLQIANPSQANIDAIVQAGATTGILSPKIDSTVEGDNYQWVSFQKFLTDQIMVLKKLIQMEQGPIYIPTRYKT